MTSHPTNEMNRFILTGAAVLVDAHTLLPKASLLIAGEKIVDIIMRSDQLDRHADVPVINLEGHVLIPGFVNAHTHLELGYARGKISPPSHFADWVLDLMALYPGSDQLNGIITRAASDGAMETLHYGVTTVGDITRLPAITRPVLNKLPLRVVSFGEITALGKSRDQLGRRLTIAADRSDEGPRLTTGLSPHAPYSVEGPALQEIVRQARLNDMPLAMHLAELAEETDFLRDLSGPLGRNWELMRKLELLDVMIPLTPHGPIQWASQWGLLRCREPSDPPVVLAHVNHVSDADIELLAAANASVAFCPRTHHYFGHPKHRAHPWRQLRAAGVNVCLATDSLASNPDLSPLREAQWLLQRHPACSPMDLVGMITSDGAAALGRSATLGRLKPGFYADIQAFSPPKKLLSSCDQFAHWLVQTAPRPEQVWVGGQLVKMGNTRELRL